MYLARSRLTPRKLQKLLEAIDRADRALCDCALSNCFTDRGDEACRHDVMALRRLRLEVTQEIAKLEAAAA